MVFAKQAQVKFRRRYKRLIQWAALLLLLVAGRVLYSFFLPSDRADAEPPLRAGPCEIVEVFDGATFLIRSLPLANAQSRRERKIKVRLLSVAVPDYCENGESIQSAARDFTATFLNNGQAKIELDRRSVDADGTGLVYIYVDEVCLNESLVRAGLARVVIYPGDSRRLENQLRKAEEAARLEKLGIWAD